MLSRRLIVAPAVALAVALAGGCAARGVPFPPEPARGSVFNALEMPAGAGPFPAVVLLHTCGGLQPHVLEWARLFRDAGYAALVVDSFTPRGARVVCGNWAVSVDDVVNDAFAALAHLRTRPGIDGTRVGAIGFSYGAMAALRLASARYQKASGADGFRALVAVYPLCVSPRSDWPPAAQERANNLSGDVTTPTLVLIGEADTDTPNVASNCAAAVTRLRSAGRPIDIVLYPGAGHAFDTPRAYDAAATQGSREQSLKFFGRHLGLQAAR